MNETDNRYDQDMVQSRRPRRLPLSVCLAYLLVATMILTGVSISGYVTAVTGTDEVRVAVMAADVTVTVSGNIPISPGNTNTIPVTVTNEENGRVCEVSQRFTMSVRSLEENIPLSWKIYRNAECTEEVEDMSGTLKAGEKETVNYWIQVSWLAGTYPASYAFEVDALEIKVLSEQID